MVGVENMFRDPQSSGKCSREGRECILKDSEVCEQEGNGERQSVMDVIRTEADIRWSEQPGAEVQIPPDQNGRL